MKEKKRNPIVAFLTFKWFFRGLVHFYKRCISPLLPSVCIYRPSCSSYMLEAIDKFGVWKGIYVGTKRLLRCVPWAEGGFDPVPYNPKGEMKWLY